MDHTMRFPNQSRISQVEATKTTVRSVVRAEACVSALWSRRRTRHPSFALPALPKRRRRVTRKGVAA